MYWSKFNLLSNLIQRYFVESDGFIGMSFMYIFGNAGSVFILAVDILMSSILVEFGSKSFILSLIYVSQ